MRDVQMNQQTVVALRYNGACVSLCPPELPWRMSAKAHLYPGQTETPCSKHLRPCASCAPNGQPCGGASRQGVRIQLLQDASWCANNENTLICEYNDVSWRACVKIPTNRFHVDRL